MSERLYPPDDFEAIIRVYSHAEGGRKTPTFNGIRWDFVYADDPPSPQVYMIWPDFFGEDGRLLPGGEPLPTGVDLPARMTVVMDEMRAEVHRQRLAAGVRFYCHEGARRMAEGRVTRITGLFQDRRR